VPVDEHMANYQAARALMGKGKSSAKKGGKKSAVNFRGVPIDSL